MELMSIFEQSCAAGAVVGVLGVEAGVGVDVAPPLAGVEGVVVAAVGGVVAGVEAGSE
jgi:hypothetical protein